MDIMHLKTQEDMLAELQQVVTSKTEELKVQEALWQEERSSVRCLENSSIWNVEGMKYNIQRADTSLCEAQEILRLSREEGEELDLQIRQANEEQQPAEQNIAHLALSLLAARPCTNSLGQAVQKEQIACQKQHVRAAKTWLNKSGTAAEEVLHTQLAHMHTLQQSLALSGPCFTQALTQSFTADLASSLKEQQQSHKAAQGNFHVLTGSSEAAKGFQASVPHRKQVITGRRYEWIQHALAVKAACKDLDVSPDEVKQAEASRKRMGPSVSLSRETGSQDSDELDCSKRLRR